MHASANRAGRCRNAVVVEVVARTEAETPVARDSNVSAEVERVG